MGELEATEKILNAVKLLDQKTITRLDKARRGQSKNQLLYQVRHCILTASNHQELCIKIINVLESVGSINQRQLHSLQDQYLGDLV